jgi:hypothetical protein
MPLASLASHSCGFSGFRLDPADDGAVTQRTELHEKILLLRGLRYNAKLGT